MGQQKWYDGRGVGGLHLPFSVPARRRLTQLVEHFGSPEAYSQPPEWQRFAGHKDEAHDAELEYFRQSLQLLAVLACGRDAMSEIQPPRTMCQNSVEQSAMEGGRTVCTAPCEGQTEYNTLYQSKPSV